MRKAIAGAMVVAAGLILGAAAAVSAQEWNIGVGGVFSGNLGGGYNFEFLSTSTREGVGQLSMSYLGEGVDVFFASKYAEGSVDFLFTKFEQKLTATYTDTESGEVKKETSDTTISLSAISINLGLWLKYPFNLSGSVKIYPMMGIDYEICTSISSAKLVSTKNTRTLYDTELRIKANDLSRAWFKAGVGGDINLSERIYLHPVVLYGVGWKNSMERTLVKKFGEVRKQIQETDEYRENGASLNIRLSHGPTVRVGVGYRFDFD